MTGSPLSRHERRIDRLHREGSRKELAWRVREDRGVYCALPGKSFVATWKTVWGHSPEDAIAEYRRLYEGVPA